MSIARQLTEQVYFALRYDLPPLTYYEWGLYDPQNRKRASSYVQDWGLRNTMAYLLAKPQFYQYRFFDDKGRFQEKCVELGIPTVPIIVEFEDGKVIWWSESRKLPETDLFTKPNNRSLGIGAERWTYEGPNGYRNSAGSLLSHNQVLGVLTAASKVQNHILQLRVLNHSSVAAIIDTALCTVRVLTLMAPNRTPEYLGGFLKLPTGNSIVDNITDQGGIAFPVDDKTGVLGRGTSADPYSAWFSHHPDTGVEVAGMQLPFWDQVVDLSLKAHGSLSTLPLIGWDIAITPGGPVVVEANVMPRFAFYQRVMGPIGESRLPEVIIEQFHHLEGSGEEDAL